MADDKNKNQNSILFRTIIEIVGAPKEHIEKTMNLYIDQLGEDDRYEIVENNTAPAEAHGDNLFVTFTELEVRTSKVSNITEFCFSYMPSSIEIIDPDKLLYRSGDLSNFLNDLQAKLHSLDMAVKKLRMENSNLRMNSMGLLRNLIMVVLKSEGNMTEEEISKKIGIPADQLDSLLDKIVEQGHLRKEGDQFSINKN